MAVGLPDADGRDVSQALRANGYLAPVVFLTAHHTITERLSGFSAGGDDYLAKPFHLAELVAHLRAARRRAGPKAPAVPGDLVLDPVPFSCTAAGRPVELTPTESRLLAHRRGRSDCERSPRLHVQLQPFILGRR